GVRSGKALRDAPQAAADFARRSGMLLPLDSGESNSVGRPIRQHDVQRRQTRLLRTELHRTRSRRSLTETGCILRDIEKVAFEIKSSDAKGAEFIPRPFVFRNAI